MTDKPEAGKIYALTSDGSTPCIANGDTWAASEVKSEVKSEAETEGKTNDTNGDYMKYKNHSR